MRTSDFRPRVTVIIWSFDDQTLRSVEALDYENLNIITWDSESDSLPINEFFNKATKEALEETDIFWYLDTNTGPIDKDSLNRVIEEFKVKPMYNVIYTDLLIDDISNDCQYVQHMHSFNLEMLLKTQIVINTSFFLAKKGLMGLPLLFIPGVNSLYFHGAIRQTLKTSMAYHLPIPLIKSIPTPLISAQQDMSIINATA